MLSIEPEPGNFVALERNIRLNGLTNVRTFNMACWSSNTELKLFLSPYGTGGASAMPRPFPQHVTVKGMMLDDILRDEALSEARILIKIDVEGATAEVLMGAQETLRSNKSIEIIFEYFSKASFEESRAILKRSGYSVRPLAPIFNNDFLATRNG